MGNRLFYIVPLGFVLAAVSTLRAGPVLRRDAHLAPESFMVRADFREAFYDYAANADSPGQGMEVSPAEPVDVEALPFVPGYSIRRETWEENDSDTAFWHKVTLEGKVVGVILFEPNPDKERVVVYALEAHPDFGRLGVGKRLLQAAVFESMRQGFDGRIALRPSDEPGSPARHFYSRLGFTTSPVNSRWLELDEAGAQALVRIFDPEVEVSDSGFEGVAALDADETRSLAWSDRFSFLTRDLERLSPEQEWIVKRLIVTFRPGEDPKAVLKEVLADSDVRLALYDRAIDRAVGELDDAA
jgi:ribosomal protein S18 acetylase RimI-like enzyme